MRPAPRGPAPCHANTTATTTAAAAAQTSVVASALNRIPRTSWARYCAATPANRKVGASAIAIAVESGRPKMWERSGDTTRMKTVETRPAAELSQKRLSR